MLIISLEAEYMFKLFKWIFLLLLLICAGIGSDSVALICLVTEVWLLSLFQRLLEQWQAMNCTLPVTVCWKIRRTFQDTSQVLSPSYEEGFFVRQRSVSMCTKKDDRWARKTISYFQYIIELLHFFSLDKGLDSISFIAKHVGKGLDFISLTGTVLSVLS